MATIHPLPIPLLKAKRFSIFRAENDAASIVVHGVLMHVLGKGILLVGEPGRGKSSLALALLGRGHALVADDAPEVYRLPGGVLYGQCPDSIFGMLHTRSDGFVDVRATYGAESLVKQCRVDVIIAMSGIAHFGRLAALHTLIGGAATQIRLLLLPALSCDVFGARDVERALAEN